MCLNVKDTKDVLGNKMKITTLVMNLMLGGAVIALAGCNSSSAVVDENKSSAENTVASTATAQEASAAGDSVEAAKEETKEVANVIRREGGVANRGAFIKILVNKTPITNGDLKRRANFLKIRREPGNHAKLAEKEMIEQALKLQEAERVRTLATTQQVDEAFGNFAKRNRTTTSGLSTELGRLGVGAPHFKEFIRTQISWQRTVQGRFQAETTRISEQDAVKKLRESGNQKPKVDEFTFKQVVFVVPQNKRSTAALAARKREANAFRQTVSGCDNLLQSIKALKDVSIIDRRHIMEPELPQNWKDAISNAGVGSTTPAQETEKGVEFMTICSKRTVDDDRAARITQQSADFSNFGEKSSEFSDKYIQELRERATIIYQ